ncbi:FecR family protein [Pedobacter africanus]|uniref:FecR family protein n=1 Tax=Pedobacter africanus TaxID=151894 RepID=A0A1W2CM85_9SPHI|nr:FecR family protein [Pedobacter africanus]SMC86323.1 FecR family protein [Pedobacter africanus]
MNKNISPELIRKYIGGNCTPEEMETVHNWYASFENEPDPLIDLELKEQLELKMRMLGRIRTNIRSVGANRRNKRMKPLLYSWVVSAAAIFIVILGIVLYQSDFKDRYFTGKKYNTETVVPVVVHNKTSSLQKHILPDSSVIWLRPLAMIMYSKNFVQGIRKVSMKGDAFFEVTKDKKHPFVIYSGGLITKVWGTSFSISYNPETRSTEVAVLTGKVSVSANKHPEERSEAQSPEHSGALSDELMLLPDEKAVYSGSHKLSKTKITENSAVSIWKKEDVMFDNITVKEIIKVLNVKFKVNITTADQALNDYVLKADFSGQSLPEILLIMEKSLNISYSIEDRDILLKQQTK